MKILGSIIGVLVILGILYFIFSPKPTTAPETTLTEQTVAMPEEATTSLETQTATDEANVENTTAYSLDEIAQHASADDCWLAIEGNVYDVTVYIDGGKHPGGAALLQGCGKDATVLFNERPNGSGAHSEKARSFLPQYLIGTIAKEE